MESLNIQSVLEHHSIFSGLSQAQRSLLGSVISQESLEPGDILIQEGDFGDSFFILLEGSLSVEKRGEENQRDHQIAVLLPGEIVGEMVLVDREKRSASVKALEKSVLATVCLKEFHLNPQMEGIYNILLKNVAHALVLRLRSGNTQLIQELEKELSLAKAKAALGLFTVNTLVLSSLYTLNLGLIHRLVQTTDSTTFVSGPIILIFSALFLIFMIRSSYPLEFYGVTIKNWKSSLIESTFWSLPFLVSLILIRLLFYHPKILAHEMHMFWIVDHFYQSPQIFKDTLVSMLIYIFLCPLQELVARGGMQSSLTHFIGDGARDRSWLAILVSNLIFSGAHMHLGLYFALSTFIPGLFWGWLFHKQKNLVGCSWSHIVLGTIGIFVIGLD